MAQIHILNGKTMFLLIDIIYLSLAVNVRYELFFSQEERYLTFIGKMSKIISMTDYSSAHEAAITRGKRCAGGLAVLSWPCVSSPFGSS